MIVQQNGIYFYEILVLLLSWQFVRIDRHCFKEFRALLDAKR